MNRLKSGILSVAVIVIIILLAGQSWANFCEDFEGDVTANWHADNGVWEVCDPASAPIELRDGRCMATVCGGNYPHNTHSRAVRHTAFVVPMDNPRLSFWHYFSTAGGADYGRVQIRQEGGEWENVPMPDTDLSNPGYYNNSGVWTHTYVDLSAWSGQTVQIAFLFHSDGRYSGAGWYIDDVCVESGTYDFVDCVEDWEEGQRDWNASRGVWQVGSLPGDVGPAECYSGANCAGTVLSGNYPHNAHSRLINPPVTLPEENASLNFQHWFSTAGEADYGKVQIRVLGETDWEPWKDLLGPFVNQSAVWTYAEAPLEEYAGQTVQIAFLFHSDGRYSGPGWYIDDICITGGDVFNIDIQANGRDGGVQITRQDNLLVTIDLTPGEHTGRACEYWVGALTPKGAYWYTESAGWVRQDEPIDVGLDTCSRISNYPVFDQPLPGVGIYTFFVVLDGNPDGHFAMHRGDIVNVVCRPGPAASGTDVQE